MMPEAIVTDIAEYLQFLGLGVLDSTIFLDNSPNTPDDIITIYDEGGSTPEKPEYWRKIKIEVRAVERQTGYDLVWNVFNNLLYPSNPTVGYIQIGSNIYLAELHNIPSVDTMDLSNRFLFLFEFIIRKVIPGGTTDDWLEVLSQWTETSLAGWNVYRGIPGNERPSVTWQLTGSKLEGITPAAYRLSKTFTGIVKGNTPEELDYGVNQIVEKLGTAVKLLSDPANKQYLMVQNPVADIKAGTFTSGQVSVTLSRYTSRTVEEAPLIAAVNVNSGLFNEE